MSIHKEGAKDNEAMKNWAMKMNNFLWLGRKIINLAEQSNILSEYATLNEDFTKWLKNENRLTDKKETGDKRPKKESPSARTMRMTSPENREQYLQRLLERLEQKREEVSKWQKAKK
ncbi:uncharacterized protein OCT59_021160 [Rhizophagus irregularis]|uniref:Uncharacterized protein n=2 Tax=Rhizophagus irregularis TaxID=588596 RepID=U9U9T0_RHIID|nr:hypothetical protein GLOIN_2v1488935 [Rhizophagus irregularis DAOM 181602=DAOM 197198]EXX77296.1 hypothetical protein RirG_025110 [Rhizophagus irregularis DAOM 197198w]POG58009.1 hypothetical protein GLOIN_2v1488935 [Rhizophagus irregularis DAOM 181602=DAOM 197198]UZO02681.1 hypothetical protein OCT59_021160 [Rhizophagus irregularis]GET60422.1 hypothetical protein GLOIN_2v1488935 [Rhizophagus irregularis DAOM 181602=DAOM 197198]|eukprot:XP_025164875.1 hypothetical protein GLOIN_2v1488935 [Rhizophagus irregularis DAOM 181602=DAOM 197198]